MSGYPVVVSILWVNANNLFKINAEFALSITPGTSVY